MSESEKVETSSVPKSLKDETQSDDVSSKDKLSIQQILEGMTNEFNKTGTKKDESSKKINKTESPTKKQEKSPIKPVEEVVKTTKAHKSPNKIETKIIKENIPEKKIDKVVKEKEVPAKQETTPKKDAPARIVFTFRTIDENTDHGKKTKISSCPSNLSLVPDEFTNCDQKCGVSVKIENFDEVCSETNKPNAEENVDNSEKSDKLPNTDKQSTEDQSSTKEKSENEKEKVSLKSSESNPNVNSENENNKLTNTDEASEEQKSSPNTRKNKQKRLKETSDESVLLKRSARRLSKESFKSTVLESAMARKERSNYTTETIKRRYSKPGRPRKNFVEKKAPVPKLNPLDTSKLTSVEPAPEVVEPNKKEEPVSKKDSTIPKLTPINSSKPSTDKKDNLPKLNPINPPKLASDKKNSTLPKLSPLKPLKNVTTEDVNVNGLIVNDSQKLNKYAGMPKLTPIVKTCEMMKPKYIESSDIGASLSDTELSKNSSSTFQKPLAMKIKRDKNKFLVVDHTKKVAKGNGFMGNMSPTSDTAGSYEDAIAEENVIPAKKPRRSATPNPKKVDISKSEGISILKNMQTESKKSETMECLCEVRSQLFVTITSADAPLYCTALDSIDNRVDRCHNEVDHDDVAMRRPSTRIPYIILCRTHKDRLIRHNCCPSCGLFCAQGRFVHCSNGHQYHKGCEVYYDEKPLCPHCASYGLSYDVHITMTGKRKAAGAQPSKPVARKEPAARFTLPGSGDNAKLAEQKPIPKKSTEPLISPELIRIPEATVTDKSERYTIMSLYNAVKNEELQKLVNVLAFGINANHAFRDQGLRTSLHIAAEKGHLASVHVLVQAGAQLDVLDKNQLSPLMLAAMNGKADVVRYLVRVGADVMLKGEDGMTALHMAAKAGHLEACKVLISECKVPRTLVDSVDDGGWTSLIWACEFSHVEVAQFLLENKCDPLIRDAEQNIALHWSAYSGSHQITEMLLNLGCDANVVNVHGDSPLHIASRRDQYGVCVLLLARGARVGEVNSNGETAIDCCSGTGDTLNVLKLNSTVNQQADNLSEKTVKILTNDITRGKESNPVQCVNGVDFEDKPTDFVYVTENCFTSKINVDRTITSLQSCRCEDNCSSDQCLCGNISLRCWYNDEGKLVPEFNYADPPMIFECNPACDCNKIRCNNRVVQHGMTQRFQLFRTEEKGWGLRTLRPIAKGAYVCEYVGEIISDSEADLREDDSYLFDLDNRDGETYCIDARRYGNLARFINHSCTPNLFPIRVFVEHQDLRFPRIAFFANRDIEADEELGFDYGEKFWIIKYKSFTCTCGAENCRYSDKTIQITLNNYRQRVQAEEVQAAKPATA